MKSEERRDPYTQSLSIIIMKVNLVLLAHFIPSLAGGFLYPPEAACRVTSFRGSNHLDGDVSHEALKGLPMAAPREPGGNVESASPSRFAELYRMSASELRGKLSAGFEQIHKVEDALLEGEEVDEEDRYFVVGATPQLPDVISRMHLELTGIDVATPKSLWGSEVDAFMVSAMSWVPDATATGVSPPIKSKGSIYSSEDLAALWAMHSSAVAEGSLANGGESEINAVTGADIMGGLHEAVQNAAKDSQSG
jgi:hypothetical protein